MEIEQHQGQDSEYGDNQWVEMNGYGSGGGHSTTTTPLHEYSGYNYGTSTIMPIEPAYTMQRPPPYTSHHQLQPLQPLIMPQWPSMLTAQASYSAPVLPTTSVTTPVSSSTSRSSHSMQVTPTTTGGSTPRRTLTDDDRRRMCQYHEDHPTVKQTEIGAMFGVERSTVSKVLRQKEKYLCPADGSQSPAKKSKGKFPDIERALANWARNEQRTGAPLTDAKIREKAKFFSVTVGNNESQSKLTSTAWLEKFKLRNNLLGAKLRKGSLSLATDSDETAVIDSSTTSSSQEPLATFSPTSSSGLTTPPESPRRERTIKNEATDSFFEVENDCKHAESLSTTSMTRGFSAESIPALSRSTVSPISPHLAATISGASPVNIEAHTRLPSFSSNFSRPRSQTFPNLDIEPSSLTRSDQSSDRAGRFHDSSLADLMTDSPAQDKPTMINPMETIKRNHSVPDIKAARATSMQPPPRPQSGTTSPDGSPSSPTQDDARRALDLVMAFFQAQKPGALDPTDWATIGKLMAKLEFASPNNTPILPGGLHRIDEHESPRLAKKRSMMGIYAS